MLIDGLLALAGVFGIWLAGSIGAQHFALSRLLLAIVSFNVTALLLLWFGKKSFKAGADAGGW